MPKVLHLINSLVRGGIEKWLLSMLRAVPRSECAMDVCCKGSSVGPLAGVAEDAGARVFSCPLRPAHVSFIRGLQRILREGHYDVLHCHLELYSGVAVWAARSLGIPVIASFHNTHFEPQTPLTRLPVIRQLRWAYGLLSIPYALRRADLVTGCSEGVLQSLDPRGTVIPPGRSRVLSYGVELPEPRTAQERADFRRSFGWPQDTPVILHVGRFLEQKNHLGMIAIFQRVLERVPTARLLLVGEGMLRPAVEQKIAEAGLADRVLLLGLRDDVPALMGLADVFLFPSLFEGLPLVAIEANAARLPVVGSRIAGLTEAVCDGETALLHDVGDLEGMANSVGKIVTDKEYSQRLGQAGHARVQQNFSTQASTRRLLEIYRGLMHPVREPVMCFATNRG